MKKIIISLSLILIVCLTYGQSHEGLVDYQKEPQPAAVIELPYSQDIVTAAMNEYLSKKGKSKGNDIKGFTTYRNTQPLDNGSTNADLYFKIERKSRKEKNITVISLLLTPKNDQSVGSSNVRYLTMEEAKNYLNALVPVIAAFDLEAQIKDQNDAVSKAEAKYKGLVKKGEDLEKKRENIEEDIRGNKKDQQAQASEVENQKQRLAVLVSERKGY
jgi:hypothetical protein